MKVCLIGNNLTSLIFGYILSKKKIYSEIYSIKNSKSIFKTRTIGIANYNLNYLSNYFKNIYKKTNPINEIQVLIQDGKIKEEISFNKNSEILFNMIKYDKLISYIKSNVIANKYISLKFFKKNTDLILLTNKKKFDLIINCEGSNILTKKYLKNGIYKNYFNKAFTTIIKHEKIKNSKAKNFFIGLNYNSIKVHKLLLVTK